MLDYMTHELTILNKFRLGPFLCDMAYFVEINLEIVHIQCTISRFISTK